MELWIRSQDREVLMQCNQVYYFEINKKHFIVSDLELVQRSYDYQPLGQYKTKERALEILDEIQEVLCPKILTMKPNSQITLNDGVNIVLPDNCSYERIGDTYVFEMPKE